MRKLTLSALLSPLFLMTAIDANAQLIGPSPLGNYSLDGGLISNYIFPARTSIGACWGGESTLYGFGYIGFNLAYDGTFSQPWVYLGDGANNAGAAIYQDAGGNMNFVTKGSTGGSDGSLSNAEIKTFGRMRIDQDGKVMIGNNLFTGSLSSPEEFRLFVEDGILTEKVRVAVKFSADWPDYVFRKDYKLMPLAQLSAYISANNHLPDVPSADEVVANGIDLQQMDARLLKKVEELTLYVLAQQKEIEELKKTIRK